MAFYSVNQRRRAIGVTLDFFLFPLSSFSFPFFSFFLFFFFLFLISYFYSFFLSLNFSYIPYRQINSAISLLLMYDERNLYAFGSACLEERKLIPSCVARDT